jgi:hypothetical protein
MLTVMNPGFNQEVIHRLKKGEILPVRLNGPFGGDHFEWRKYDVIHLYAGGIGVSVRGYHSSKIYGFPCMLFRLLSSLTLSLTLSADRAHDEKTPSIPLRGLGNEICSSSLTARHEHHAKHVILDALKT